MLNPNSLQLNLCLSNLIPLFSKCTLGQSYYATCLS